MATAADWATRVKDWEASGKTAQEFCAGRPFKAKNLVWWSSHFRRKGGGKGNQSGSRFSGIHVHGIRHDTPDEAAPRQRGDRKS